MRAALFVAVGGVANIIISWVQYALRGRPASQCGWPFASYEIDWPAVAMSHAPVVPNLPGFAANAVVLGSLLALSVYAIGLWRDARAWRRTRRGICPRCAYPAKTGDVCSECGFQLGFIPRQPDATSAPALGEAVDSGTRVECPNCGYDCRGPASTCPECGVEIHSRRFRFAQWRGLSDLLAGTAFLVVAFLALSVASDRRYMRPLDAFVVVPVSCLFPTVLAWALLARATWTGRRLVRLAAVPLLVGAALLTPFVLWRFT